MLGRGTWSVVVSSTCISAAQSGKGAPVDEIQRSADSHSVDREAEHENIADGDNGYRMTGVQQAKAKSGPPERPRGMLVQFPVQSAEGEQSQPPEDGQAGEALIFPAPLPVDSGMEKGAAAAHTRAPRVVPAAPAPVAVPPPSPSFAEAQTAGGGKEASRPRKNWLKRLFFPDEPNQDKRRATRNQTPGLVAHFWTGGAPQAQPVRDISSTGLYVVTVERWYLGTQIRVTLTRTGGPPTLGPRTLTVEAKAVRYGEDGVGLAFLPTDAPPEGRRESNLSPLNGADLSQLEQFVASLHPPVPGSPS